MAQLQLTDEIVVNEARALQAEGRRYTPRQLYYATCGVMEAPRVAVAPPILGLGLLLCLAAIAASHWVLVAYGLGLLGTLLLAYGVRMHMVERHRLKSVRARVIGYDEFMRTFVEPHAQPTEHFPGLLDVAAFVPRVRSRQQLSLLVCDTAENALITVEALRDGDLDADVVDLDRLGQHGRARRVLAVHDASPRGCALPAELADRGCQEVIDVAIRPGDVVAHDLQVIEGAPAFLPRDLSALLPLADCDWLRSGRRLELAAYPVDRLQESLRQALQE